MKLNKVNKYEIKTLQGSVGGLMVNSSKNRINKLVSTSS